MARSMERDDRGTPASQGDVGARENLREVLSDVFDLLELYGPAWYSARVHDRIESALSHRETRESFEKRVPLG